MRKLQVKEPKILALKASLVLALLLAVIYAVISDRTQKQLQPKGDVPAYKTPAWWGAYARGLEARYTADGKKLLLRLISKDGTPRYDENVLGTRGDISVKPDPTVVYVFDAESDTLQADTSQQWVSSQQEVCSEDDLSQRSIQPFGIRQDGPLRWKERRVAVAGKQFVSCLRSPTGDIVAVLSTDPPLPTGQQYLEFFSIADGQRIGRPVRLPFERIQNADHLWTCDGQFVICRDYEFERLCFVRAPH